MNAHQFIKDYNIEDEDGKGTFLKVFGQRYDPEDDQPNPEPAPGTLAPGTPMAAAGATEPAPGTPMAVAGAKSGLLEDDLPENDLIIEDLPEDDLSEDDLPKQKRPYLRKYSCTKKTIKKSSSSKHGPPPADP